VKNYTGDTLGAHFDDFSPSATWFGATMVGGRTSSCS
jgi:hypothetical protein